MGMSGRAWPAPLTGMMFSGNPSPQLSPFSADATPVYAGSNSTRSRKSSATDYEWLRPVLDAGYSEPSSPTSLPVRGTSSMSIGLNTAVIFDNSAPVTPSSIAGGESTKAEAMDGEAFFFKRPADDAGPSLMWRGMGA